jgi:Fic family protein
VSKEVKLYMSPDAMEPLFPDDESGELESLAISLISKSGRLSGTMNPETRKAVSDFLRPMNSYYSNLIEGHDTHPIDIEKALRNDFSDDKIKRDLQKEAHAHIRLHEEISLEMGSKDSKIISSSMAYIKSIHKRFYDHLPEDFKVVKDKEGNKKNVAPGTFRESEVEVGRHIAPFSGKLNLFTNRFEEFYNPVSKSNKSKIRRIISIAAAHHRLAWIHPFLDGNGRVVRLYSDACLMYEHIDASGLWSISRGLARKKNEYQTRLANADLSRYNDYDGRGNLSNKMLVEFCKFFLETAIDQVDYMYSIINIDKMLSHIASFTELMVLKNKLRPEAKYILTDVFLKGKISKPDAMRITNTSDKTLKKTTDTLIEMGLLEPRKEGILMMYYVKYPVKYSPMIFPGMYPSEKETDMIKNIG